MALTTYTTYTEIRAILGVSSTELTDSVLSQPAYDFLLTLSLEDIDAGLPAKFVEILALPTPTAEQTRFLNLVKLYAPYSTAKELLTSLSLFAVKQLTDGRAEFQRQDDVFADVRDGVESALISIRARLAASYAALTSIVVTERPTMLLTSRAAIALDPVTNA